MSRKAETYFFRLNLKNQSINQAVQSVPQEKYNAKNEKKTEKLLINITKIIVENEKQGQTFKDSKTLKYCTNSDYCWTDEENQDRIYKIFAKAL